MGVTNAGKSEISGLAGDTGSKTAFTALAYGTGSTAFAATQTALVTESQRAAATVSQVTTTVSNDTLQLTKAFTISSTETITEVGIFNNATSGGTMLARTVLSSSRSVVSGDTFTLTYKVAFA
jgi:hypothetical protein